MGLPGFAKILKYGSLAIFGLAAVFAAIAAFSSPAAAKVGGGARYTAYPWDTDNLAYTRGGKTYNAQSFNIPFHKYGGYSGVAACQSKVADGFFQTDNSVVNDFPHLVASGTGANVTWGRAAGSAGNDAGCDDFVAQQDRLAAQIAAGFAYSLDRNGNLVAAPSGTPYTTGRTAADLRYGIWTAKASSYSLVGSIGATTDADYLRRADGHQTSPRTNPRAIFPSNATWTIPTGTSNGRFGTSWHGTKSQLTQGHMHTPQVAYQTSYCDGYTRHYLPDGRYYDTCNTVYYTAYRDGDPVWVPATFSDIRVALYGNQAYHLTRTKAADLCPSLFHPRGEDASGRIGGNTGRTLGGLTHTLGKIADRYWCRSDLRYTRRFAVEVHTLPAGITAYSGAPASGTFTAYGRLGCYYTTTGQTLITGSSAYECGYSFPLPRCDSDKNGTADREYTAAEVQALVDRGTITVGRPFTIAANGRCVPAAPPPSQAGFSDDACVTARLRMYENRSSGSDAEPGVLSSDRTVTGTAAWDLDITSPHPKTASPPRGTGDASGCADGSEDRADHSASPGGAARKQSPAPSYASSDRTDTAVPPNDADDDIDYSGATRNMAHRYASRVAEHTCSVKLQEAKAELALLEALEAAFTQWLSDYKTASDSNARAMRGYRRIPSQSGGQLSILQFNDSEKNKADYAAARAPLYTALSTSLAAAKTGYDTTTDRASGANRAAVIEASSDSGCTAHYDAEISRLQSLFAGAEKTARDAIKAAETAVWAVRLAATAQPNVPLPTRIQLPAIPFTTRTETTCQGTVANGQCWGAVTPPPGCEGFMCGIGNIGFTSIRYYTCQGISRRDSGTVTGTYEGSTRTGRYDGTYTAPARGESTAGCPGFNFSGTTITDAVAYVMGTAPSPSVLPAITSASAPAALGTLNKLTVLGSYYITHADRANLEVSSAADRNTAGNLTATIGTASGPAAIGTWQRGYTSAYDTAFTQAAGHMSGTAWEKFDWRYETSTLAWGNYQEDPAAAYSASTATPRDGTGCDLVAVASDGGVTVSAARLDFETSRYGIGSVYSSRSADQRTCKIRRERTPQLRLIYAPDLVSGTDTAKTADTRLDTDSTATNAEFYYVDYQPTSAAERFKLYDEAEIFAIRVSLADAAPTFCWAPGTIKIAHAANRTAEIMESGVPAPAWAKGSTLTQTITPKPPGNTVPASVYHRVCDTSPQPASGTLGSGWVVYDDTARSLLASVYASNTPCAGGTATPQQYLPTGARLTRGTDRAWRYPTGTGGTPTGWRAGQNSLTMQSAPFTYMNATDNSNNKTCTPVALRIVDCSVSAEDAAYIRDIQQAAPSIANGHDSTFAEIRQHPVVGSGMVFSALPLLQAKHTQRRQQQSVAPRHRTPTRDRLLHSHEHSPADSRFQTPTQMARPTRQLPRPDSRMRQQLQRHRPPRRSRQHRRQHRRRTQAQKRIGNAVACSVFPCIVVSMGLGSNIRLSNEIRRCTSRKSRCHTQGDRYDNIR